jgi:hypothetical protein
MISAIVIVAAPLALLVCPRKCDVHWGRALLWSVAAATLVVTVGWRAGWWWALVADVAIVLAMGVTLIVWNWRMLSREAVLAWRDVRNA